MSLENLPIIRGIVRNLKLFKSVFGLYIPPGHYYSPIVSKLEVRSDARRIFRKQQELPGIQLNLPLQKQYLESFKEYYAGFLNDYSGNDPQKKYTPKNGFYSYSDGIFLYCMMRYFKPARIIEVGSGFSSALMYDVCRGYFNSGTELTFIEPYPEERLLEIFAEKGSDFKLIKSKVQEVEPSMFDALRENDILFIDSSHVTKTGSDVNFLLFEILPKLKKGVIVHFHDIFYPFEYPQSHVLGKRWFSWNEAYMVRAFMTNNSEFEIIFWNSFLEQAENEYLKLHYPKYFDGGSASIWIRKR